MKKPKLVCIDKTFLNDASGHHLPLFSKYFAVSNFDPSLEYDSNTTFIYQRDEARAKAKQYEKVSKFIADAVWETEFFCLNTFDERTLGLAAAGHNNNNRVLQIPKWFWFEEHFSQQDKKPLIKSLPSVHHKSKSFLLQMGDAKPPRVKLYNALERNNLLNNALYSFLAYGIALEGPCPTYTEDHELMIEDMIGDGPEPPFQQRAYRPEWYNTTQFTLVAEAINEIVDGPTDCFITEKTMKPIMYGHPFLLLSDNQSYKTLESWGFNTFPELFDQSIDNESDLDKKIESICIQIANYKNLDVQNKIQENFQRFWNRELVEELMIKEMIEPMLEFISKK